MSPTCPQHEGRTREETTMTKRLTDNEIAIRIVPTHQRWPKAETSIAWRRLHECVQQLHDFARNVDNSCIKIEQKRDLGRDEIARLRTDAGQEALKKLANFRPLNIAKQVVTKEIDSLEKREDLIPQETQAKQKFMKAMDEMLGGIAATERLLLERCSMRERPAHHLTI
jgi:hypothetical protein